MSELQLSQYVNSRGMPVVRENRIGMVGNNQPQKTVDDSIKRSPIATSIIDFDLSYGIVAIQKGMSRSNPTGVARADGSLVN